MKKTLLRAGLSPLENFSPLHILQNNSIGSNVGNLVYAYSIYRALTKEDTEVIPNYYKYDMKKIDEYNESYDCFVIPLADAFRNDFITEMQKMTKFINKLKIPCIVTGVGLRTSFEPELNQPRLFDDDVKEFMKAVLKKSAIVGVRGEITGDYLARLGFKAETDYTVIGCPSMYTFGKGLTVREKTLTKDSLVSINNSVMSPNNVQNFLERSMKELPNHYFIPQRLDELRLLYAGTPYTHQEKRPDYPCTLDSRLYVEDRVKFFNNVPTWLEFLRTADLSFGSRLHGNVAAVVSGTPALFIPHDGRMRELTEYHNLTHIWAKDVNDDLNIFELAKKMDFKQILNGHDKRFEHYVDFLDKNKIDHIYHEIPGSEAAPIDAKMAKIDLHGPVESMRKCSIDEMVERWNNYYPSFDRLLAKTKKRAQKAEKDLSVAEGKLQKAEKSVKELTQKYSKYEKTEGEKKTPKEWFKHHLLSGKNKLK